MSVTIHTSVTLGLWPYIKDYLPCWLFKNDLVEYFMQHVQYCLMIQRTNSLKNNIS